MHMLICFLCRKYEHKDQIFEKSYGKTLYFVEIREYLCYNEENKQKGMDTNGHSNHRKDHC